VVSGACAFMVINCLTTGPFSIQAIDYEKVFTLFALRRKGYRFGHFSLWKATTYNFNGFHNKIHSSSRWLWQPLPILSFFALYLRVYNARSVNRTAWSPALALSWCFIPGFIYKNKSTHLKHKSYSYSRNAFSEEFSHPYSSALTSHGYLLL